MAFLSKFNIWYTIFGVVCLLVIASFLVPAGHGLSRIQIKQHQSDLQLRDVSQLVLSYRRAHDGELPAKLSDLVPQDKLDYLRAFYAPNQSQKPVNYLVDKSLLDRWADYVIQRDLTSEIVAFEKPGLWPDRTIAVCYKNLTVARLTPEKFSVQMTKRRQSQP
ncbi:MAG: hypothetical protein PHC88_09325 [Terrimicrobiaceae bacterium]|nr:hypothetical protein [Terrimicrobiaceae bacterium]